MPLTGPQTEFPSQRDERSPPSEGHMASAFLAGTVVPKRSILGHTVPVSRARWGQRQLCTADFGDLLRGSFLVKLDSSPQKEFRDKKVWSELKFSRKKVEHSCKHKG